MASRNVLESVYSHIGTIAVDGPWSKPTYFDVSWLIDYSLPDKSVTAVNLKENATSAYHFVFVTYYVILTLRFGKCHRLSPLLIMIIMMLKLHVKSCIW